MEKALDLYNKLMFALATIGIPLVGIAIKKSDDVNFWYRLLNVEAILVAIWLVSSLEIIEKIYIKKNLRDYINASVIFVSAILLIMNGNFLSVTPRVIDLKYITLKFGIMGSAFYITPFLFGNYSKTIKGTIKLLTLFSTVFIYSRILTEKFRISTFGFFATVIFLTLLYLISFKEKNHEE